MEEIDFTLLRRYLCETYTIGKFSLNDYKLCDTLEDKVRDYNKDGDLMDAGETKIFGETAIPYGRYRVVVTHSPKFKRETPLLLNVRHFDYIRMHSGAKPEHSLGCVLVGENKIKGGLINGRVHEARITKLIKEYIARNCAVFVNIV
jgi:hypothetical protein